MLEQQHGAASSMEQQHERKKKIILLPRASQPASQPASWLTGWLGSQPTEQHVRVQFSLPDANFQVKFTEVGPKMAHGKAWEKHRKSIAKHRKAWEV